MAKQKTLLAIAPAALLLIPAIWMTAQDRGSGSGNVFRVEVDMVQLNVAVTDNKGNYVTGLHPSDFAVTEDAIAQKLATFGEGNEAPRRVADIEQETGSPQIAPRSTAKNPPHINEGSPQYLAQKSGDPDSPLAGASVFILFDTSNYMYRGFVFAQDAIADFVRSLDHPDRVAFYSYSRDLYRAAALTEDRSQVLRGVRGTTVGDDAALYNALLMTLKDASQFTGRKVIVVFSNGPDNSSMVAPEDIGELAQSEGVPIYIISTRDAKLEPVSTAAFGRLSASTGGISYYAKSWKDEQIAFASVRDDLSHLYSLSYYPQPNPNTGWRRINVKLVGEALKKYHIRTRSGYRPRLPGLSTETASAP